VRYFSALCCARPCLLLRGCFDCPRHASGADQPRLRARTLLRLVRAASEGESSRGGSVALARRRYELTDAQMSEAWLDWLPDSRSRCAGRSNKTRSRVLPHRVGVVDVQQKPLCRFKSWLP